MNSQARGLILICALGVVAGCGGSATTTTTGSTPTSGVTTAAGDPFAISGPQPTGPIQVTMTAAVGDRRKYDIAGEMVMSGRGTSGKGPGITEDVLKQLRESVPSVRTKLSGQVTYEVTKVEADQTRVVHLTSRTGAQIGDAASVTFAYEGDMRYRPDGTTEVGELTLAGSEGVSQANQAQIESTLNSMRQTLAEMSKGVLGVRWAIGQQRRNVVPKSATTPPIRMTTTYRGRNAVGDHIFERDGSPSSEPFHIDANGIDTSMTMNGTNRSVGTWSDLGWLGTMRANSSQRVSATYQFDAENTATLNFAMSFSLRFIPAG